ncbi:hypothetical protein FQR65_LT09793 [Abscondita terminalis]|nr:hypothetical protein FQR65_LT09793 [Abscondita terminalis]
MSHYSTRWEGKLAVVTGASAGIGQATAEILIKAGARFSAQRRQVKEMVDNLKDERGKFYPFVTDMTKEEDIIKAFEWCETNVGPVHILVNCAGIIVNTNLIEGDTALWKKLLDTNVLGLCIATREAFKSMKKHNIDGHIVHMNSCAGHKVVYFSPKVSLYPASKFAVTALTETLRQELNLVGSKIKVSSISPGLVYNDFRRVANIDLLDGFPGITSEDVADAVFYVLNTPPHVQVSTLLFNISFQYNIDKYLFKIHELIIKPIGEGF